MTDFAETARNLAAYGWPVFPCMPGGKAPVVENGVKDASTDPEQVTKWWKRWPSANIGLATGGYGPGVLDFDNDKPGLMPVSEGYDILKTAGLLAGAGPIVRTRSGGWHLYFLGGTHGNAAYIGGYPIDYRGIGGYVITAPSVVDNQSYVVTRSRSATQYFDVDAAKALLAPPPPPEQDYSFDGDGDVGALVHFVEQSAQGERRPRVFWALIKAAENGNQEPVIRAAVDDLGLEEKDIRRQAKNAARIAGKNG
jgi:hypothetical protein